MCFDCPTEVPAKADLRNKFRYCGGGSAIRASSIALAFGHSWGGVKLNTRPKAARDSGRI